LDWYAITSGGDMEGFYTVERVITGSRSASRRFRNLRDVLDYLEEPVLFERTGSFIMEINI
jgi:hypothetical protein